MTIYDHVFPLGLGTNRFPLSSLATEQEIEQSAEIVLQALNMGVNYIDTAMPYSNGHSSEVLRRALQRTSRPYRITTKLSSRLKTADAAQKSVESHLAALGIDHASDLMIWSIFSYAEFQEIMRPGGIYEGALQLKAQGIVDHLTFSVHASPNDMMQILKEHVFEGMMLSMSVLNATSMKPVLDYAAKEEIGVAVMNPLGGGFIPQKKEQFSFLCNDQEHSIIQAALRFVKSCPAVKIVVAGPASLQELTEDVEAFSSACSESAAQRQKRVFANLFELEEFCTGCRYCEPCPQGIPIPTLMQSRNALLFEPPAAYRCTDPDTLKNIQVFKRLNFEYSYLPETSENPCIRCGACEGRCTQKLKITEHLADIYKRMQRSSYSLEARRNRLDRLLHAKRYQKVAIWPGGTAYATFVVKSYRDFFGEPPFELVYFNSSPALYGQVIDGCQIYSPDDLAMVKPDCVLVISYTYQKEIAQALEKYDGFTFDILKLHTEHDVPWLY